MRNFDSSPLFAATLALYEYMCVLCFASLLFGSLTIWKSHPRDFYQTCKKCKYIDPHNKIKAKFIYTQYGKIDIFIVAVIKFQSKILISSNKIWSGNTDNANYAQADKRQGYWSGSN